MKKILAAAVGAAFALVSVSAAAAEDVGSVFVNAGLGQSHYHVGGADGQGVRLDNQDFAGAVRLGYVWHSSFDAGAEIGYVDLGKLTAKSSAERVELSSKGWMAGLTGRYVFSNDWYVSLRSGWFHAEAHVDDRIAGMTASGNANGDGWYAGAGVGYVLNKNFSVGVNYDNYHGHASNRLGSLEGNIGTYMVTAEYRF